MAHQVSIDELHCVLCCEDIEYSASGPCDHSICLKCCVKLRMLRKESDCPVCRAPLKEVIVSKGHKSWADKSAKRHSRDMRHFGILHEGVESQQKVDELLENKCPVCDDVFRTFLLTKNHVRKTHSRYYCDICLQHLKLFTHERKCYTREELVQHRKHGDSDDKSHRGHPLCQFCDDRYLDNDDLLLHLRKNHFWCHLCEKDGRQDYFPAYKDLREHFRDRHFLCEAGECFHEKFTSVFRTKVDLQAHRAQKHSDKLSKAEARQNRQLDVDITFSRPQEADIVTGRDYSYPEHSSYRHFGARAGGSRDGKRMTGNKRSDKGSDPPSRDGAGIKQRERGVDVGSAEDLRNRISKKDGRKEGSPRGKEREKKDDAYDKRTVRDKGGGLGSDRKGEVSQKMNEAQNGDDRGDMMSIEKPGYDKLLQGQDTTSNDRQKKGHPTIFLDDFPTLSSQEPVKSLNKSSKQVMANPPASKPKATKFQDDFPTLSSSQQPVKPLNKSSKKATVNPPVSRTMATKFQDDFPALSASQPTTVPAYPKPSMTNQQAKSNPAPKNKAVAKIQPPKPKSYHEEFPTLKHTKPVTAPPGLAHPTEPRPPPGLTWNVAPMLVGAPTTTTPGESKDKQLIQQIHQMLRHRGKDFVEFKTISGQFRTGQMTAQSYYEQCCNLLGERDIHKVFSKLIDILPDEGKQQELLTVYNDAKVLAKQTGTSQTVEDSWGNNPLVPPVSLCEDFPALPSSGKKTTKAQRNKLNTWVNGK